IWMAAAFGGLCRIDTPEADRPAVVIYRKSDGLVSEILRAVTADAAGRIYILSIRGIDRLDPAGGVIEHFSSVGRMTGGEFRNAFCDRNGILWFSTSNGLSRVVPEQEQSASIIAPIFISSLRISGEATSLSELGETAVAGLELTSGKNN